MSLYKFKAWLTKFTNKTYQFCYLSILFFSLSFSINHAAAEQLTAPCQSAEHKQFDFWIGDWEVKDSSGKLVGHNSIFPILNGCALSENWTSAAGNNGVSYNFFDKSSKQWHQTWIDDSGSPLYLNGSYINNQMVLQGEQTNAQGSTSLHKITWTLLDDGRVSQYWQLSNDEGKTWNDIFLGFYNRK